MSHVSTKCRDLIVAIIVFNINLYIYIFFTLGGNHFVLPHFYELWRNGHFWHPEIHFQLDISYSSFTQSIFVAYLRGVRYAEPGAEAPWIYLTFLSLLC